MNKAGAAKPKKKKSGFKSAVRKLDQICRKILLLRDSLNGETFRCISCQRVLPLECAQVGHYASRRHILTRWDLQNIHLQCVHCNKYLQSNPIEYRKNLIRKIGIDEVLRIEGTYRNTAHFSSVDLQEMYEEYRKILESYQ